MSLNIKNPEVHELALSLARRLDTSMTGAVAIALREKLAATESGALEAERLERLLNAANRIAARLTDEQVAFDIAAELYDAQGLPR